MANNPIVLTPAAVLLISLLLLFFSGKIAGGDWYLFAIPTFIAACICLLVLILDAAGSNLI